MGKIDRKRKRLSGSRNKVSESNSDTDDPRPQKKIIRTIRNGVPFSSTPHPSSMPFFGGPSTSTALPELMDDRDSGDSEPVQYENFASFINSTSLDSDDEGDLLTVSQLAENGPSTSSQNNTTRRSITVVRQNACMEIPEIKRLKVPIKNLEFICAHHPTSLTLSGFVKVSVLVGTVTIQGYDVTVGKKVHVFSSKRSGYKRLSTKMSVVCIDPEKLKRKIESVVVGLKTNAEILEFIASIGSFTSVFMIERVLLTQALQFLELYFPVAVEMEGTDMYFETDPAVEDSESAGIIAGKLTEDFLKKGPSILVYGPKQSGKSTMLRYLVHAALNLNSNVFYLDADPGQTEFTPPGVVSLVKVNRPLLGPPYSHISNPVRMIFTGSNTPVTDPPFFVYCVQALFEYFKANCQNAVLFVNTCGWIEGLGDEFFKRIKAILNPTMLIQFLPVEKCGKINIESEGANYTVNVPIKKYPQGSSHSAKLLREFALMAYFGKCIKFFMTPTHINLIRPYRVKWDDIAISVWGMRIEPYRLIEAIQCSIVALCQVDESFIKESEDPKFPRTVVHGTMNVCIGYGFVRAYDEAEHLLYIVTPLSQEKLAGVNSIIKGDGIIIPDDVFFKQPVYNTPLPYTWESYTPPTVISKNVKKRTFIPQKTPRK